MLDSFEKTGAVTVYDNLRNRTTPYHQGYKAYYMHGPDAVNPFLKGTKDYEEWSKGYRASIDDRKIADQHSTMFKKKD